MKLALVIPTFQRTFKLKRLLDSVAKQTYTNFDVHIYYDNNDFESCSYIKELKYTFQIYHTINDKQEFVIGSWNKFFKSMFELYLGNNYSIVQWLVDDVALYPDFLEQVVNSMEKNFPDTDGVIGTRQECPGYQNYTFKWFGQSAIGRKFIERYKEVDYKVCCPFYSHFYQDEEMWMYATSLGKFINCSEALLKHYHPAFVKEEVDTTHPLVRGTVMRTDKHIYQERKEKGLIWGKSWS
jgi:glycosyltransferase involved in cell wall biosynthesis